MIYIDPPYGIKFASNFQPTVFQRDVKDREQDLTREREQIKAYRDTWTLGIHSYLAYLRDRLIVAKELLTDSGSVFVQIGDENVHRVRSIMEEVFNLDNFIAQIYFKTTSGRHATKIDRLGNYILWFAKDIENVKYHNLFVYKEENAQPKMSNGDLQSQGVRSTGSYSVRFEGKEYRPLSTNHWKTIEEGMHRLIRADRVFAGQRNIYYKRWSTDFPVVPISDVWTDVSGGASEKVYVVQTNGKIIERCLLMTTDPGDLVLDPTCGSGTTAYVSEQRGRRWITIDTSRVAIALARQRLLTASFDYYQLKDEQKGIAGGISNKTVRHVTLGGIAQNTALDPIFAKHESILKEKLDIVNRALAEVTPEIRSKLLSKLAEKERREGKKSITDADRRRWQLPDTIWQEWEVPFDTDPDWPKALQEALTDYRKAWREKMDEVNDCIAKSSEGEELVDQPEVDKKRTRVNGPFTVEAVQPPEESLDIESPIGGEPEEVPDTFDAETDENNTVNAEAYLDQMIRLLQDDGVRFPNNQTLKFATLDPIEGDILHAEGDWEDAVGATSDRDTPSVVVVFGPQHGPVTAMQVEQCLRAAYRFGYDDLVFAGFSFDGAAQATIQDDLNPNVRIHIAHINPDVAMGDLLKETPSTQLFTVFGMPRTKLEGPENGEYLIKMEGVDIYNPVDNTVSSAGADKVAAWFVDSDYDGRTFCITQAFFPDKSAWDKIARALKSVIDEDQFEKFSGTESLPFPAGEHACVAVKVIDPRGNEVMRGA